MQQFGKFLGSISILYHLLIIAVFLCLAGWLIRRSAKLRPYTGQLLILVAIAWIAALFTVISFSFPKPKGMMASATDASTVPRLWAIILIPIGLLALLNIIKGKEGEDPPFGNLRLVGTVLGVIAVSLFLFDYIGYYLSSALFIFVIMLLLKAQSKVQMIAVPVGWVVFTYVVFARILYVPLPIGKLFSFFIR